MIIIIILIIIIIITTTIINFISQGNTVKYRIRFLLRPSKNEYIFTFLDLGENGDH